MLGGVASADDRYDDGRDGAHRSEYRHDRDRDWGGRRDHRDDRDHRFGRPKFVFRGNFNLVPRVRYRDYYRRPPILIERPDVRPGFIWVSGQWTWDGVEWRWVPGHYHRAHGY
ncbi:MAG: YXWGXW repeat-containing protein [Deltaproteobacteria bacterium]|nr:YXWGXW repeat-containing protein [Deltaproteobacteria bacterium]